MPSESKEDTPKLPLTNKQIYILGPGRLQNELMSRILEEETGAVCEFAEEIDQVLIPEEEKDNKEILILIDCQGKDINVLLSSLPSVLVALFNVTPGTGIEDDIAGRKIAGLFYETDPLNRFVKGVRAIFNGELWFSREVMTGFVMNNREIFSNRVKDILTQREIEIMSLIAVGTKNEEIAEKLFVSNNTVKTHIYNIFKKINVTNRLQAALWAAKNL